MKGIIVKEKKLKALKDGLDPNTVDCKVSNRLAKINMIAAAGEADHISFTKKKLQIKTESRFRAEHSVMAGFSYAVTALMTHYFEGPRPAWMGGINYDCLSSSTKKTFKMVREAFRTDEIYPANPNLVLSTDDTTLFVFEGKARDTGEEEWE